MNPASAFITFVVALVGCHLLFLRWIKTGRRFWLLSEYIYYSIGLVGILASVFALTAQAEKANFETELQHLVYEIDNVTDRLRTDRVLACSPSDNPSDADSCFAYSMAIPILDIWRARSEFPIAGIPACNDIAENLKSNEELAGISMSYHGQRVLQYVGVEAAHPLCVSEEYYKRRNALGHDPDPKLDSNSIRAAVFHISELMSCPYRYCEVYVFMPYDIELRRIDRERAKLAAKVVEVNSNEKFSGVANRLGTILVCFALALRLTKTSSELRGKGDSGSAGGGAA